jgi:hypothetical protein
MVADVVLSERNLRALLHKLVMDGSARTLETDDTPEGWRLRVRCETNADHYGMRPFPPGSMHPDTEREI